MKAVTLNAAKAGITRLRTKGGASPDSLYDLTNGYVTASRSMKQRPGTTYTYTYPEGSKGLCSHDGKFHAFAATPINTGDATFVVETLRHPDAGFSGAVTAIHFAQPFLGYIYVVAEFDDGQIFHYWLQQPDAWEAEKGVAAGDLIQPTTPNGYYYKAHPKESPNAWAPGIRRNIGDFVQPTVANGFKYKVVTVVGDTHASGAVEPIWPTEEGEQVWEFTATEAAPAPTQPTQPPGSPGGPRYDNPGGGCVVLDAFVVLNGSPQPAGYVRLGNTLALAEVETLAPSIGGVTRAVPSMQPCVRVVCANGVTLACSTTAPIGTRNGECVITPQLLGEEVATRVHGTTGYSKVVEIIDIGARWVMEITVGDKAFWAGDIPGKEMLHHNKQQVPQTPRLPRGD